MMQDGGLPPGSCWWGSRAEHDARFRHRFPAIGFCLSLAVLVVCCADAGSVSDDSAGAAMGGTTAGYGDASVGGTGGDIYRVTSLEDEGRGTLRDGIVNRSGPRTIVFDVAGTITLAGSIAIRQPHLTIDGSTAPAPGITIRQTRVQDGMVVAGTHDIILRHLRFVGAWVPPEGPQGDLLSVDADSRPDFVAQRIVLDHLSLRRSSDGAPDLFGDVRDVTVSWCLIFDNLHPTTITGPRTRERISMHHNVYAGNDERNPQIRGEARDLDFVNNVIYNWGAHAGWGYGLRVRNSGDGKVNANIVNNAFLNGPITPNMGLVYGSDPGPDSEDGGPSGPARPQGTVLTSTQMGSLWVSGNILPSANSDHYSTASSPLPVPPSARVQTWPAAELGVRVLPSVGMKYRDAAEQELLTEIGRSAVWSPRP